MNHEFHESCILFLSGTLLIYCMDFVYMKQWQYHPDRQAGQASQCTTVKTRYMDLRMWSSHHYYPLGILLAIPIDGLRPPFFNAILKIAIRSPQTPQTAKASSSLSSFFFFFLSSPGTISPGPVVNPFWAFQVRFQRGTMVPPSFGLSQDALVPTRKERYLMILMPWKTSQ